MTHTPPRAHGAPRPHRQAPECCVPVCSRRMVLPRLRRLARGSLRSALLDAHRSCVSAGAAVAWLGVPIRRAGRFRSLATTAVVAEGGGETCGSGAVTLNKASVTSTLPRPVLPALRHCSGADPLLCGPPRPARSFPGDSSRGRSPAHPGSIPGPFFPKPFPSPFSFPGPVGPGHAYRGRHEART